MSATDWAGPGVYRAPWGSHYRVEALNGDPEWVYVRPWSLALDRQRYNETGRSGPAACYAGWEKVGGRAMSLGEQLGRLGAPGSEGLTGSTNSYKICTLWSTHRSRPSISGAA